MKKHLSSFFVVLAVVMALVNVALAEVKPSVYVNGSGDIGLSRPEYLPPTFAIELSSDETVSLEWWLMCLTPTGWKHFDLTSMSWIDGQVHTYQGELPSFPACAIPVTGLDFTKVGTFTFSFGYDLKLDGKPASDMIVDATSLSVVPEGKAMVITIYDDFQIIGFDLSYGTLGGFVVDGYIRPITYTEVVNVMMVSDRVGWGTKSSVKSPLGGVTWLYRTPNNDRALWALELTGGKIAYVSTDDVVFAGKQTMEFVKPKLIEYGDYKTKKISCYDQKMYIGFGANVISGFGKKIEPSKISRIQWNSDVTGWMDNATIQASPQKDGNGNYYLILKDMPAFDSGLISAKMKDGTYVWLSVSDGWIYEGISVVGSGDNIRMEYGSYRKRSLKIENGKLILDFASSNLAGFVSALDPTKVVHIQWNSDLTKWMDAATIKGALSLASDGTYYAELGGMPSSDSGLVCAKMKDGSYVWMSVGDNWTFTGGAKIVTTGTDTKIVY